MTDSKSTLPPMRLGEIVLKTRRYEAMKAWYRLVLDMEASSEHVPITGAAHATESTLIRMCFFRLHAEHPCQSVVAIFEVRGMQDGVPRTSGLHHMQLRNASKDVLYERFRRLRAAGTQPDRAMDHGPGTSLYYRDPDENIVERAASNFTTMEEMIACLASEAYSRNPAGRLIDLLEFSNGARSD